jgi:Xaa-Pro aminopeptidase
VGAGREQDPCIDRRPGRGIVGVEDTILVTSGDPEYLTFTPRELTIL